MIADAWFFWWHNIFSIINADGGIEEDKFEKSECELLQHLIGNEDNKFVIINADEEFQVQSLTMKQQSQPGKIKPNSAKYYTFC